MIVELTDLREALERAAELDEARRRHPHDVGLRQRLHTAVDRVRRVARALERGGALVFVAAALAACSAPAGGFETADDRESIATRPAPPYRRVTYFLDPRPECSPVVPGAWEAAADAFSLWAGLRRRGRRVGRACRRFARRGSGLSARW